ncbi:MAG: hypothetical protein GXY76_08880 [Chloroflexi bacterium]|nr:hypothetical protein [Chloroflexota bacterium]
MGNYGTPVAPTALLGFALEPAARVLLGTGGTTDLETTSWPAQVYGAPIGLAAGAGVELGILTNLGFSSVPTITPFEAANFEDPLAYEVSGEECTITVECQDVKPQVLKEALGTGHLYILGSEALITWGGGCSLKEMPLVIEWTSVACKAPSAANIGSGITGGIFTFYKVIANSGLPWSAFNAKERVSLALTFRALHDTAKARGNRLGSLYLY